MVTSHPLYLGFPGSNLGPDTRYPKAFRRIPQSLKAKAGQCLTLGYYCFLLDPFQFTVH
jgi:hypothetical protein